MAEPAPIYDPEDKQPVTRPDLKSIEGGSETAEPKRRHLQSVKDTHASSEELDKAEKSGGFYKPDDAEADEQSDLGQNEKQIGEGYKPDDSSRLSRLRSKLSLKNASNRKKWLIGGGVGGGIVSVIIATFLSLLPLKLPHIMSNLQSKFFATSESAVERRADYLFGEYLTKKVLPSLGGTCPSSTRVSRDCVARSPGSTMAERLFNGWRDANLEGTLANKYGIEFERSGSTYLLKVDGGKSSIDITGFANDRTPGSNLFVAIGSRNDIRNQVKEAFKEETRWKQVLYRFKVGRLLERKHGIRRCLFACKLVDSFDDWKDDKKNSFKKTVLRRVVIPHTEHLGVALLCITSGSCDGDPIPDGEDHQRRDKLERDIAILLQRLGRQVTKETVQQIADVVEAVNKSGGVTRYVIETVVKKATNEAVGKAAGKGVPIVGWIDFASQIINTVANAGSKLKRWAFVINSTAMVSLFVMYRSHADELKNGRVDPELLGAVVDSLGDQAGPVNKPKNQTAEISPLYGDILGTSTKTSLLDIVSPSAYAAGTNTSPQYKCDNGDPIEAGKKICPEESLITSNFLTDISKQFNEPPLSYLADAAAAWKSTVGGFFSFIGGIVGDILGGIASHIPGFSQLQDTFEEWTGKLLEVVAQWLIPTPITDEMSGARAFNMAAGGADVSGNDYAHYGLGGNLLNADQVAAIRNEQEEQAHQTFAHKSFFARMLDGSDSRSFASRVAMKLPTSLTNTSQNSFANLISNPFTKLAQSFGSIFSTPKLSAATFGEDPFGIPQYGYAVDNSLVTADSSIYTDAYCQQLNTEWAAGTGAFEGTLFIDEEGTGMDIHTQPNPCLLEEAATGSAGGFFTDSVLTKADLTDPGAVPGSSVGTATSCAKTRIEMVADILGHQSDGLIFFDNPGPEISDIQDPAKTTDKLICVMWSILEQGHFPIVIGAINSDHDPGGLHVLGRAVDLARDDTAKPDQPAIYTWLYNNRQTLQIDELIHMPIPPNTHLVDLGVDCDVACYDQATLDDHYSHIHLGVFP